MIIFNYGDGRRRCTYLDYFIQKWDSLFGLTCGLLWDGVVMAIDIGIDCEDCFGDMVLYDPPVGRDYDEQGKREAFCDDCGGGFKEEVLEFEKTTQSTFVNALSNNKLSDLLHVIIIRNGLPHLKYREKQSEIQNIRSECDTKNDLIEYLINKFNENHNFLESNINLF